MRIIVTGGTGMVGAEVLREAIKDPKIERITAISRSPLPVAGDKIRQILHKDFLNYRDIEAELRGHDACLWCLGVSQNDVSREEYIRITLDYTVAGARAMLAANPEITFCFLSGSGSDPSEKSMFLFGKIKGRTESALDQLAFKKLYHFRPGFIYPLHPRKKPLMAERLGKPLVPLLTAIAPGMLVSSGVLARAMLRVAEIGYPERVIHTREIQMIEAAARDEY